MTPSESSPRPSSRRAIIDAAITLFASDPSATTSEVALQAGVGRATLHRHFRSREDLLETIATESLAETEAAVRASDDETAPPRARLEAMLEAVLPLGNRFHFLSAVPLATETLKGEYQRQLRWLLDLVDALKADGEVDSLVPSSWVVSLIDQLIWAAWREVAAGRLAAREAPALALRSLLHGLAPAQQS